MSGCKKHEDAKGGDPLADAAGSEISQTTDHIASLSIGRDDFIISTANTINTSIELFPSAKVNFNSLLVMLPSEIRDSIWRYIVLNCKCISPSHAFLERCRPRPYTLADRYPTLYSPFKPRVNELAIAQTCRSISEEVYKIYYGENVFRLHDIRDSCKFLEFIGFEHRTYVRHLQVSWFESLPSPNFHLLRDCILLETLAINIHPTHDHWIAGKLSYRGLKPVLDLQNLRLLDPTKLTLTIKYEAQLGTWSKKSQAKVDAIKNAIHDSILSGSTTYEERLQANRASSRRK